MSTPKTFMAPTLRCDGAGHPSYAVTPPGGAAVRPAGQDWVPGTLAASARRSRRSSLGSENWMLLAADGHHLDVARSRAPPATPGRRSTRISGTEAPEVTPTVADALQPRLVDLVGEVHQVRVLGAGLEGDLDQPHRVRGVLRADHDHQVRLGADLLDGDLAVLGGVADVVARRADQRGEALLEPRRRSPSSRPPTAWSATARRPCVSSRTWTLGDVLRAVHQVDAVRRLAHGADDLLVALVADEQDVVVLVGEARRPPCGPWSPAGRSRRWRRACRSAASSWTTGATPCAEKITMAPSGTSSVSSTKIGALLLQGLHDVLVVDDLLAHVDRRAVLLERLLDGDHGAVHARAVATGGGEQDTAGCRSGHAPMVRAPGTGVRRVPAGAA